MAVISTSTAAVKDIIEKCCSRIKPTLMVLEGVVPAGKKAQLVSSILALNCLVFEELGIVSGCC